MYTDGSCLGNPGHVLGEVRTSNLGTSHIYYVRGL